MNYMQNSTKHIKEYVNIPKSLRRKNYTFKFVESIYSFHIRNMLMYQKGSKYCFQSINSASIPYPYYRWKYKHLCGKYINFKIKILNEKFIDSKT